jgi:hypothetical protein
MKVTCEQVDPHACRSYLLGAEGSPRDDLFLGEGGHGGMIAWKASK